jgi:hypothetical protein
MEVSSELPATHLSLLRALDDSVREQQLISLGVFYERYRGGLAKYLERRFQIHVQDAYDILHDFLIVKVADGSLIHSYLECVENSDSRPRTFRSYLVRSLSNYTLEQLRKRKVSTGLDSVPAAAVIHSEMSDLYTLEWAIELLSASLRRLRRHYLETNNELHWLLFAERWLAPILTDETPLTYVELAKKYKLASSKEVANILANSLRTLKSRWWDVLSADLGTEDANAIAEALSDTRLSFRMSVYVDGLRFIREIMPSSIAPEISPRDEARDPNAARATYESLLELFTGGFDNLLPSEQRLLFETYIQTPICDLYPKCNIGRSAKEILSGSETEFEELRVLNRQLKRTIQTGHHDVPKTVAGIIRFLVIATAELRFSRRITTSPEADLQIGMRRVLGYVWLCEDSQELIRTYLEVTDQNRA